MAIKLNLNSHIQEEWYNFLLYASLYSLQKWWCSRSLRVGILLSTSLIGETTAFSEFKPPLHYNSPLNLYTYWVYNRLIKFHIHHFYWVSFEYPFNSPPISMLWVAFLMLCRQQEKLRSICATPSQNSLEVIFFIVSFDGVGCFITHSKYLQKLC